MSVDNSEIKKKIKNNLSSDTEHWALIDLRARQPQVKTYLIQTVDYVPGDEQRLALESPRVERELEAVLFVAGHLPHARDRGRGELGLRRRRRSGQRQKECGEE